MSCTVDDLASLVSPEDVAAHLRVYAASRSLLTELLSQNHIYRNNGEIHPLRTGRLLLRYVAYRFKLWVKRVLRSKHEAGGVRVGLRDEEVPPLDVLLFLHGYMLAPHAFYEDTSRIYPELRVLNGFPLHQAAARIDDKGQYLPTDAQLSFWEGVTGKPFVLPLVTADTDTFEITCPKCMRTFSAGWQATTDKDGEWKVECDECGQVITDRVQGATQAMNDIRRALSGEGVGLAGTLLAPEGVLDPQRSRALTAEIANSIGLQDAGLRKFGLEEIVTKWWAIPGQTTEFVGADIPDRYNHTERCSLDVGGMVLSQANFASKMYALGWTNPRFAIERKATLEEIINRYGGFLRLAQNEDAIPTNDIDLVWHTHQLLAGYREDSMKFLGFFMNHVVTGPVIAGPGMPSAFEDMIARWEKVYGTPYYTYLDGVKFPIAA